MAIRSIKEAQVDGKTVFVRVDFNTPMRNGLISDDSRIVAALPTLNLLRDNGARVIVASHLGRPAGKVIDDLRIEPVRIRVSELLEVNVTSAGGPNGSSPVKTLERLESNGVALLENLRFDPGEENNNPEFSRHLASLADLYVNDAFGAAHRAHASTTGITTHLPSYAGLLMEKEINMLGNSLNRSKGASVAVVGGAKVADKIHVLKNLTSKVDTILIGGGMLAAFLIANNRSGGAAEIKSEEVGAAKNLLDAGGAQVILPADVVTGRTFQQNSIPTVYQATNVPHDALIMDIGPRATKEYARILGIANTILWNGPMGVFEWEAFSKGSIGVARAIAANLKATSVIGGGSTAEIVKSQNLSKQITHVSTGGGASLEYLEGKILPGVAALDW
ncbi:MAG: phosphoglycerate kinase [SAR202 cluster bacterium]|nr:phosphoglycerate kinase [SAR202 cluster bacterium]